ncbi:MAG: TerB family tellurite resistance protein [Deltaproteobacteria bacterium]|nr:TerB family tellurite resistance protein [Deltaproteobacteria bacterium]MBW1911753.1 TerB family tellurite resistance protein [Deltaproteobacteria bacterium]
MGWFGKLTFGSMGLLFGGPLGAIAGAALGHHLVDKRENQTRQAQSFRPVEQSQAAYFVSMFSILGKLAKVDGVVTRDEIAVVEDFLFTLDIPEREKIFAKQIFGEAKNSQYSIDDFAMQLFQMNRHQPAILLSFMDLLFKLAAADGKLHHAEEDALDRIKAIFRISDQQFESLKAVYFKDVDKYYTTLSCTPKSSDQEIKASYKNLVKDFHPDTIISKGLPEEFVQFATTRFQEIQGAYEKIRKERGF